MTFHGLRVALELVAVCVFCIAGLISPKFIKMHRNGQSSLFNVRVATADFPRFTTEGVLSHRLGGLRWFFPFPQSKEARMDKLEMPASSKKLIETHAVAARALAARLRRTQ